MKILFLDDDELRHTHAQRELVGHDVYHVRTAKEAVLALEAGGFDVAMLDHDLGGTQYAPSDEVSGYMVARAIADGHVPAPGFVVVHSYNPPGAQNMVRAVSGQTPCVWAPFGPGAFRAVLGAAA